MPWEQLCQLALCVLFRQHKQGLGSGIQFYWSNFTSTFPKKFLEIRSNFVGFIFVLVNLFSLEPILTVTWHGNIIISDKSTFSTNVTEEGQWWLDTPKQPTSTREAASDLCLNILNHFFLMSPCAAWILHCEPHCLEFLLYPYDESMC